MSKAFQIIGPKFYAWDPDTGAPLAGGKVYFYETGTSTPKDTYTDETAAVANANPVILNAAGYADIYLAGIYKMVLNDSDDALVWEEDPVTSANMLAQEWVNEQVAAYASPTSFTVAGNQTALFTQGRRVRITDATTVYGIVRSSSYSTVTTVTVDVSANLTASVSGVALGLSSSFSSVGNPVLRTVADLRAFDGPYTDNQVVETLGCLSAGDGGGGFWRWDATCTDSDNTGTVVLPSGHVGAGRWLRQWSGDIHLAWFGAVGDGVTDDSTAFTNAIAVAESNGSPIIGIKGKNYAITGEFSITGSGVGFDFNWATVTGGHFLFDGTATFVADSEDWSTQPTGNFIRNAFFAPTTKIAQFMYVRSPLIENIVQTGTPSTTHITFYCCEDAIARDIEMYSSAADGQSFGILSFCSDRTLIDNVYFDTGPWTYVVQVKGGRDTVVQNCVAKDVVSGSAVADSAVQIFRDRGDNPGGAWTGGANPYPYSSGNTVTADARRASVNTNFSNCTTRNCVGNSFLTQESLNTTFRDCAVYDGYSGFVLKRTDSGTNWGLERGFRVLNCRVETTDTLYGIAVSSADATEIPDVIIDGCYVSSAQQEGIVCNTTQDTAISNCTVLDCGQGTTNTYAGIRITDSTRPRITNTISSNDAGATQKYGILCEKDSATITEPYITNCKCEDNATMDYLCWHPGFYSNNSPGEGSVQTTDGSNEDNTLRVDLPSGNACWIECLAHGYESGGDAGVFWIGGLFTAGSPPVQVGSTANIITAINPGSWGGISFVPSGDDVRIRIVGKAATTIDWVLQLRTTRVPA